MKLRDGRTAAVTTDSRQQRAARRGIPLELVSLLLLLAVWQVLAMLFPSRLFPTPIDVGAHVWTLATTGKLLPDLGKTLTRASIAFVIAMALGTAIGIGLGRSRVADRLFSAWVVVGLNVPAIVIAIVLYIWLGLTEFALILAVVLNKLPLVIATIREGVRSFDPAYDDLGRAFRMPFLRQLRLIAVPQLMPFVLAAARTGLSLIWKIVLVFEVLGSDGGVGFRISVFFQFFDIKGIFAYTTAFILVVFVFEYLILPPARTPGAEMAAAAMTGPRLDIAVDGKRFDFLPEPLLERFDLVVEPSSVVALVGPPVSGKSTLLRMVGGIDTLFSGTVSVDGVPASAAPPAGFVFQDARLLPWLTALDNIRAVRPETTEAAALEMLGRVGLSGFEHYFPHELSGGMQRRVALARAFSVNPRLLLLDEPFVSLDRTLVREMEEVLSVLIAASRPTVLLVTHLPEDAAMLADRAIMLAGRPARIAADYRFDIPRGQRSREQREAIATQIAASVGTRETTA